MASALFREGRKGPSEGVSAHGRKRPAQVARAWRTQVAKPGAELGGGPMPVGRGGSVKQARGVRAGGLSALVQAQLRTAHA
eukprot:7237581-Alexandrium_andersonii.AAC.1